MPWIQTIDPLKNIPLSALVAAIPVIFIFWALIKKMKGYVTSLLALAIAIFIALLIYGMPFKLAMLSTLHGSLYGLFPISWIIISAVFLFTKPIPFPGSKSPFGAFSKIKLCTFLNSFPS